MSAVLKPQAWQLVPMTEADIARVVSIENTIYEFPWTPGNFTDSLQAGYHCWLWVDQQASAQHPLAGYAVVMVAAGEAHLLNLSVARTAQGRGLGAQLLEVLMAAALAHGAHDMLLEVRPSNTAGRALYARAGFNQLGVRKNYYPAQQGRENALVLGRALREVRSETGSDARYGMAHESRNEARSELPGGMPGVVPGTGRGTA